MAIAATTTSPAPPATASRRRTLQERQIFSARAIREARHGRERPRRLGKGANMTAPRPKIDPSLLPERLLALPALDRVRAAAAGLDAYLVGGSVRDLLLGRERADIDVAVEGDAVDELARRLGEPREPTSGSPPRPCARTDWRSTWPPRAPRPMLGRARFRT